MRDFDRPLDATGRADADAMGAVMAREGVVPERVICSSARRARETWDAVMRHVPVTDTIVTDQLYITDATGYLNFIRDNDAVDSLLIVGHNPMIEDVCFALARDGRDEATGARANGFPTCGLAVIDFDGGFGVVAPSRGFLEAFYTPIA
ncbi:MAG: histidine phosphatase family protein [Mesorhizobium sp.]|nr:histidine phosphatase family protein [Mesorhizobium sp.]